MNGSAKFSAGREHFVDAIAIEHEQGRAKGNHDQARGPYFFRRPWKNLFVAAALCRRTR